MSDWPPPLRYLEQWDPDAADGSAPFHYGVWDQTSRQWVVRGLRGPDAGMHAAILSLRYGMLGDRPDGQARWLNSARHVELTVGPGRTEIGLLHMWVREGDRGWYGFLTYLERHPLYAGRWAPSSKLRPLGLGEIEAFEQASAVQRERRGW